MSATQAFHPPSTKPRASAGEVELAAALAHLLARDDERPARWLAPAFADAVERARLELHADARGDRLVQDSDVAALSMFHAAVTTLARDPWSVAVAIRLLEVTAARRLPSWPELVQRRGPTGPVHLDASLWFG